MEVHADSMWRTLSLSHTPPPPCCQEGVDQFLDDEITPKCCDSWRKSWKMKWQRWNTKLEKEELLLIETVCLNPSRWHADTKIITECLITVEKSRHGFTPPSIALPKSAASLIRGVDATLWPGPSTCSQACIQRIFWIYSPFQHIRLCLEIPCALESSPAQIAFSLWERWSHPERSNIHLLWLVSINVWIKGQQ